tara:strand:+ start:512 stop:958 length:447 start_codon:yes stop_codon:yes gene_type:complete
MDRNWKNEIQAAAALKPARKAFDALWQIRICLAEVGNNGMPLGKIDGWESAVFLVDQNLVMHHAKPFYDAGGNPPLGYADRFIGREEAAHVICNKTGTSSSVTNAQLGAFCVMVQNLINDIHWSGYLNGNMDTIHNVWCSTISASDLV